MNLSDEQQQAVDWLKDNDGLLLATPGAGTTRTVLGLCDQMGWRALIIAPASVVRRTWSDEAQKAGSRTGVVPWAGPPGQRRKALESVRGRHLAVSYELAPKFLFGHTQAGFDLIVFDEVTRMKTPTGKRYQKIRNALQDFKGRKIGLTGTPSSNHYHQLYGQLQITAGLPMDYAQWLEDHFAPRKIRVATKFGRPVYTTTWMDRYNSYELIRPYLEPRCYRMPPPKDQPLREIDHWVTLPEDALKLHELKDMPLIRQRQVAQGRLYADSATHVSVHTAKQDRLAELLEDLQGEPVLIFYQFRHDLVALTKAAQKANAGFVCAPNTPHQLADATDGWNKKEIPVLALHPQSAGHGLNLQAGGRQIIWYGLPEDAELYEQGNRRLARQGQPETVMVHRILAEQTVDEDIAGRLYTKQDKQAKVIAVD